MNNPFETIENRLNTIESLLLDIKHSSPTEALTHAPKDELLNVQQAAELLAYLKQGHRKSDNEIPPEANTYLKEAKPSSKYNNRSTTQIQKVYKAFYDSPKTMKEVAVETGVMRANICRYCRTLVAQNKIFIVGKRRCKITKSRNVTTYTSNPDLAPKQPTQLSLF